MRHFVAALLSYIIYKWVELLMCINFNEMKELTFYERGITKYVPVFSASGELHFISLFNFAPGAPFI